MLEKFFDAHLHLTANYSINGENCENQPYSGCISLLENEMPVLRPGYIFSYGVHPWNPDKNYLFKLEELLKAGSVAAVGECGLDKMVNPSDEKFKLQMEVFDTQIELAVKYGKPLVIHGRKVNEELFSCCSKLLKCPSVLFHSFMGSVNEAESFLRKGLNVYFSFGKQVLNGNKNVINCVKELPLERLLCETDAPYQFLKGESQTYIDEIEKVYEAFCSIRATEKGGLCRQFENNFKRCFGIL